ncbi:MAG: Uma2 family endonuclease [Dysgonamonadaceae bacterium]|jgi:Uma2 family endonuclease|nr:Uma2 family endonuclease [Dysgonamonadaceae bacterium]
MEIVLDRNKRYTYADYLTWLDNKRRELIDGAVHLMSPSASKRHADISGNISWHIKGYIRKRKGCYKVYTAPFDVRLSADGEKENDKIYTVVQPDICVICDPSKLNYRGCLGAPDMVVEILSPSTGRYDYTKKFDLYEASGVREYWIVDPGLRSVSVYLLQADGKYDEGTFYEEGTDKIPVHVLDGLSLDRNDIFEE